MTSLRSVRSSTIVLWAFALGVAAAAYGLWVGGWSERGAVLASRYSARLALYWFITAWSASSLAQIWHGGWRMRLLARRRAVGLGFASVHGIHFFALTTAIVYFGHHTDLAKIIGGGVGYAFVASMAATSNDASVRALGAKRWKLLHMLGGLVVFAIFLLSYFQALSSKPISAAPAFTLMAIALAVRLFIAARKYRNRANHTVVAQSV